MGVSNLTSGPASRLYLLAGFREVVRHVDEDAFLEPTTCAAEQHDKGERLYNLKLKKVARPRVFWSKPFLAYSKHHHLLKNSL